MSKYYYVAEAVYDNGDVKAGKTHKDVKRCYEDLRQLMNKASSQGLISIGINRYVKEAES